MGMAYYNCTSQIYFNSLCNGFMTMASQAFGNDDFRLLGKNASLRNALI
jgi:hypothetical protein